MESESSLKYRETLIEQIRLMAEDLKEMAPDLVGNADRITDLEIHLKFEQQSYPTLTIVRGHIGKNVVNYFTQVKPL